MPWMLPPPAMEMLACEACAVDIAFSFATGHRKPSVAPFPAGFDFKGHQCFTACFTHRSILDMPPPDDWRPQRNYNPRDAFLMDFENEILHAMSDAPRGPLRHGRLRRHALNLPRRGGE